MILCSALWNMAPEPERAWLLRRLDHAAIYLKIAGTYTPFALITGQGLVLTLAMWIAAALGVAMKTLAPARFRLAGLALYLGMGWAGLLAGGGLVAAVPGAAAVLMVTGGAIYTAGLVFFLWEALPFHTAIWHGFVLAATFVFYAAVVVQVAAV